jgi:hypothetical protein
MRPRRGFTLQPCNAEAAVLPDGVTCVYMNNVFEHLHDPYAVLAKSRAGMPPGGLVVLVVPNHRSWAAALFGTAWPGYDRPEHIWGFTPPSIRGVLERVGFDVLSIDQKYPFTTHCWWTGISGVRLPETRWPDLRRRIAEGLGRYSAATAIISAWWHRSRTVPEPASRAWSEYAPEQPAVRRDQPRHSRRQRPRHAHP